MTGDQPPRSDGTTISHSQIYGSAVATGAGASATVYHSGDWNVGAENVRVLIHELRTELTRLDEADDSAATAAASASGVLTKLEAEITRPQLRRERIQSHLTALATSLGGLGAISETVGKLVDAVTKLLG